MAGADGWTDVGAAAELAATPLQRIAVGNSEIALSFRDGSFGAVANACGPLGEGCLDSDYIVCPWHHWKFHRVSGVGEPGFEEDRVPSFPAKVEHGRLLVNLRAATRRTKKPHPPHPLARPVARAPGPLRLAGISLPIRASRVPTTYSAMRSRLRPRSAPRRD
jgi:nitrite reductase/ring-hydroxylating ferredoxin subunit